MFKKVLLLSAILALTSSEAFAYGTYMGLTLGINNTSYRLIDAYDGTVRFNTHYPNVGFFVGNGTIIGKGRFYLGAEMFLNAGTGTTGYRLIDAGMDMAKVSSTYTYGADAMPGIKFSENTLLYARLGAAATHIQLRGYTTAAGLAAGQTDSGTVPSTFLGARLGFGVQQALSKNLKVRGEYIYTAYRTLSVRDNLGVRDRLTPTNNQVNVALAYEFT